MIAVLQCGTFDVLNYGDLLFPLILRRELERRLGAITLTLAAPTGGLFQPCPDWPMKRFERFEEAGFFAQALAHDAIVVGGGDLIRFDDESMTSAYGISGPEARATRCFRLFIDDMGRLTAVRPVLWNAIGVPKAFTTDQRALVRERTGSLDYLSVRDDQSRDHLVAAGVDRPIQVVPDTALVVSRLFSPAELQSATDQLRTLSFLPPGGRSLVVQISPALQVVQHHLARVLLELLATELDLHIVLLPIGICHHDREALRQLRALLGERTYLVDTETTVVEVAAVIAQAQAFVGFSLHGNITAAAYGIPHLVLGCVADAPTKLHGYLKLANRSDGMIETIDQLAPRLAALVNGQYPLDPVAHAALIGRIDDHYDHLAERIKSARAARALPQGGELDREHRTLVELVEARVQRPLGRQSAAGAPLPTSALTVAPKAAEEQWLAPLLVETHHQLAERDHLIGELVALLTFLRQELVGRDRMLTQREAAMAWLTEETEQQRHVVAEREATITWLQGEVEQLRHIMTEREATITWLQGEVEQLRHIVTERDAAITWLQGKIEQLRQQESRQWPLGRLRP